MVFGNLILSATPRCRNWLIITPSPWLFPPDWVPCCRLLIHP